MIVLHGSWLCDGDSASGRFAFWGERPPAQRPRRRAAAAPTSAPARAHPSAAAAGEIRAVLSGLTAAPAGVELSTVPLPIQLPSRDRMPVGSPDLPVDDPAADGDTVLATWRVEAVTCQAA